MITGELVILQPYVPQYRVPFFDALVAQLDCDEIRCRVVAPRAEGAQRARDDEAVVQHPWQVHAHQRTLQCFGRRASWLSVDDYVIEHADGVIVGLMGSSIDGHRALGRRLRRGQRVGLWGHIGANVKRARLIDVAVEGCMMRHCDHVFAYTRSSAAIALEAGVEAGRVTAVMNSVDTAELLGAEDDLTSAQRAAFTAQHGLTEGKVLGFAGGLDGSKRIDFLAAVLKVVWQRDPQVVVLHGGAGVQRPLLDAAVERGQVVALGRAGPREKAMIGALAKAFLMHGRIGLIAMETLALGLALLTTRWPHYGPEFDYLTEGISVRISANDVYGYAELMLESLASPTQIRQTWDYPNLAGIVANYARGVKAMMT